MPNQRKRGKRKVGVWMTPEEEAGVMAFLESQGFQVLSDFLRAKAEEAKSAKNTPKKGKTAEDEKR